MCGLVGIVGFDGPDPERAELVRRMTATLAHRGPDGDGFASQGACELGFRRLAIIDVEASTPPFSNEDGSVQVVANAEIYNFRSLTGALRRSGHQLHGSNDCECLPHLYEEHGSDFVKQLDGMFAGAPPPNTTKNSPGARTSPSANR